MSFGRWSQWVFAALLMGGISACSPSPAEEKVPDPVSARPELPFSADSAYAYTARQVAFGPRVPGTAEHAACADWLASQLGNWADTVMEQRFEARAWDGTLLPLRNLIGVFQPEAKRRVLLCAHWDTRPVADEDSTRRDEPIPGADDGASGVAVLLELARQLHLRDPGYGVDILLLDGEDYGNADYEDSYCLGSQYWGRQPHVPDYNAEFGILLDMVGGEGATFYREGISMHFAPDVVERVWRAAATAGHRSYFVYNQEPFPPLTDDHLYINRLRGIPTIDIIPYDRHQPKGFGAFWHTHDDNMGRISRRTLQAVGETLSVVLWDETPVP
jgi:hypothetical protein